MIAVHVRNATAGTRRFSGSGSLTAVARAADGDVAIRAGFHTHAANPVTASELVSCVVAAVEAARG